MTNLRQPLLQTQRRRLPTPHLLLLVLLLVHAGWAAALPASCSNGVQDGDESNTDCGGSCGPCYNGASCSTGSDCVSGVCSGGGGTCVAATCSDGVQNQWETDVDCGGGGRVVSSDSTICPGNSVCPFSQCCSRDEECGTSSNHCRWGAADAFCDACAPGAACVSGGDCSSFRCVAGVCQAPSCSDGVRNADEVDVDCGGSCPLGCAAGQHCAAGTDCQGGVCQHAQCAAATCFDGLQNGQETGMDCGGGTCAGCADGSPCASPGDCWGALCSGGVCLGNANTPVFDEAQYTASVPDLVEEEGDELVAKVHATDADTGPSGQVVYSIVAGNGDGVFSMSPYTGELCLVGRRESSAVVHTVTVRATDGGKPPKHADVDVLVALFRYRVTVSVGDGGSGGDGGGAAAAPLAIVGHDARVAVAVGVPPGETQGMKVTLQAEDSSTVRLRSVASLHVTTGDVLSSCGAWPALAAAATASSDGGVLVLDLCTVTNPDTEVDHTITVVVVMQVLRSPPPSSVGTQSAQTSIKALVSTDALAAAGVSSLGSDVAVSIAEPVPVRAVLPQDPLRAVAGSPVALQVNLCVDGDALAARPPVAHLVAAQDVRVTVLASRGTLVTTMEGDTGASGTAVVTVVSAAYSVPLATLTQALQSSAQESSDSVAIARTAQLMQTVGSSGLGDSVDVFVFSVAEVATDATGSTEHNTAHVQLPVVAISLSMTAPYVVLVADTASAPPAETAGSGSSQSQAWLIPYAGAQVGHLVVACDPHTSCSGHGTCATGDTTEYCICDTDWGSLDCSQSHAPCLGNTVEFAVPLDLPPLHQSGQQRFALVLLGCMVVVLLLRLAACCQPGWVPSPQTRLDKSVQIERNWRNRVVLTSLWCEAMAVVAPACVAQAPWFAYVPVKLVGRTLTLAAVRSLPVYGAVFGAAATVAAVLVVRLGCGVRRAGGVPTPRTRKLDKMESATNLSLSHHNIWSSMDDVDMPIPETGATSKKTGRYSTNALAFWTPAAPITGCGAVLLYVTSLLLFVPLVSPLLGVWRCGYPFQLSAACPDSIQCWSTVHVLACALAGCTLVALTLSATLAFSRVHRMDSPVGLEGVDHRLMPHQRLQIQLDNGYIMASVLVKCVAMWASLVLPTEPHPFPAIACGTAAILMWVFTLVRNPTGLARANTVPRMSWFIGVVTCWCIVCAFYLARMPSITGLLGGAPPAGATPSLGDPFEIELATTGAVIASSGLWLLMVVGSVLWYWWVQSSRYGGAPLFLPRAPSGGGRDGNGRGSVMWTGSFRHVEDWEAMDASWGASQLDSINENALAQHTSNGSLSTAMTGEGAGGGAGAGAGSGAASGGGRRGGNGNGPSDSVVAAAAAAHLVGDGGDGDPSRFPDEHGRGNGNARALPRAGAFHGANALDMALENLSGSLNLSGGLTSSGEVQSDSSGNKGQQRKDQKKKMSSSRMAIDTGSRSGRGGGKSNGNREAKRGFYTQKQGGSHRRGRHNRRASDALFK